MKRACCEIRPFLLFLVAILKPNTAKRFDRFPVPLLGRVFASIPDLAVFRRFAGLLASGWYNLSSGPRKCLKSKIRRK